MAFMRIRIGLYCGFRMNFSNSCYTEVSDGLDSERHARHTNMTLKSSMIANARLTQCDPGNVERELVRKKESYVLMCASIDVRNAAATLVVVSSMRNRSFNP